jgi:hypothetical protein
LHWTLTFPEFPTILGNLYGVICKVEGINYLLIHTIILYVFICSLYLNYLILYLYFLSLVLDPGLLEELSKVYTNILDVKTLVHINTLSLQFLYF